MTDTILNFTWTKESLQSLQRQAHYKNHVVFKMSLEVFALFWKPFGNMFHQLNNWYIVKIKYNLWNKLFFYHFHSYQKWHMLLCQFKRVLSEIVLYVIEVFEQSRSVTHSILRVYWQNAQNGIKSELEKVLKLFPSV